jgi:hypothetical protein
MHARRVPYIHLADGVHSSRIKQCSHGLVSSFPRKTFPRETSPVDDGGEFCEALVHQQTSVPADGKAFEPMEVGDGLINHPSDARASV